MGSENRQKHELAYRIAVRDGMYSSYLTSVDWAMQKKKGKAQKFSSTAQQRASELAAANKARQQREREAASQAGVGQNGQLLEELN